MFWRHCVQAIDTPEAGRGAKEHCVLGNKILVSEMFRVGI